METIETVILQNVEIQSNGIIRNEKGRLIGRLVDDVDFNGEHVKGVAENDEFQRELSELINKYSLENKSNTHDFVLAAYLSRTLSLFGNISKWRDGLKGY